MKMRLTIRAEFDAMMNAVELRRSLDRAVNLLCLDRALDRFGASVFGVLRDDAGNEIGNVWLVPIMRRIDDRDDDDDKQFRCAGTRQF